MVTRCGKVGVLGTPAKIARLNSVIKGLEAAHGYVADGSPSRETELLK